MYLYDVFVSYAPEDRAAAKALSERLSLLGLTVFFDTAKVREPDDSFPPRIAHGINSSRVVLAVWTPHALTRSRTRRECCMARELGILVPVALEPLTPADLREFADISYESLVGCDWEGQNLGWSQTLTSIARRLEAWVKGEIEAAGDEFRASEALNPTAQKSLREKRADEVERMARRLLGEAAAWAVPRAAERQSQRLSATQWLSRARVPLAILLPGLLPGLAVCVWVIMQPHSWPVGRIALVGLGLLATCNWFYIRLFLFFSDDEPASKIVIGAGIGASILVSAAVCGFLAWGYGILAALAATVIGGYLVGLFVVSAALAIFYIGQVLLLLAPLVCGAALVGALFGLSSIVLYIPLAVLPVLVATEESEDKFYLNSFWGPVAAIVIVAIIAAFGWLGSWPANILERIS